MLTFRIRRNFLLALGLACLLLIALLAVCIAQGEPTGKILILAAIMIPVLALMLASWRREIRFDEQTISARRLLNRKRIPFAEVTAVDTVRVRRRVFVSISTEEDFLILSNNYDHFDQLLAHLCEQLPEAVISEETRALREDLPAKSNDIFSVWLAVVVLLLILYVQLGGAF